MKRGTENDALMDEIVFLEKSAKKNKAQVWADAARLLSVSRRRRVEVNLGKLAKFTKANAVVVVPGKLLGIGELKHKVTVAAWSSAKGVREKIAKAGGKMVTVRELVDANPEGKGVIVMR